MTAARVGHAQGLQDWVDTSQIGDLITKSVYVRNTLSVQVRITSWVYYNCKDVWPDVSCGSPSPLNILLYPGQSNAIGTVTNVAGRDPQFDYKYTYQTVPSSSDSGSSTNTSQGLTMSGNTSWQQQNSSSVTLHVDRVQNNSSGRSGSIRLRLWATASAYSGGTINGYILATYSFSQVLGPNQYYSNVTQTIAFTAPSNGTYHTTLTLEEYTASGWVIRNFVTYSSTSTWGPSDNGDQNPPPPQPGLESIPFSFPDRGGVSWTTPGSEQSAQVGYARIQPAAGSATPPGMAIFSYRSRGVLVSEASVPTASLVRQARIYAEHNGPVNTGVAIANPNNQPTTITFFFTRSDGVDFGSSSTTIPANGQLAKFLNEAPFNGGNFQGSFTFTSMLPVSVVALRGFTNERGDFLITTLPVGAVVGSGGVTTQVISPALTLPHFAEGGGWTTQVILVNPSDATMAGTIQFLTDNGQITNMTANGSTSATFSYSIPGRGSFKLATSGAADLIAGSVRIKPTSGNVQPVALSIFSYRQDGITVTEAGAPSISGSSFRMYAESGTGISLANTSSIAAVVRLELSRLDGSNTTFATSLNIPPNGHLSRFLFQLFPSISDGPPYFQGVLSISTISGSGVAVVGLRGRYNERGEFLITTTPAVSETATSFTAELLFPHLVDGGGYTTQFVLFSSVPGQSNAGTLRLIKEDGSSLPLKVTRQ